MERYKYAVFTPLYRREMANMENRADFYEEVDNEVDRLLQRTPQNHPTLPPDASPEEARAHWERYAEETRFQIIQNSRYISKENFLC